MNGLIRLMLEVKGAMCCCLELESSSGGQKNSDNGTSI